MGQSFLNNVGVT